MTDNKRKSSKVKRKELWTEIPYDYDVNSNL
jgi:hypothetical protein